MPRVLGAILAGGQSIRFGSDKAQAMIGRKMLIDCVAETLAPQVDALVVCGRPWRAWQKLDDRPAPSLGPLGGLNAALHYARDHGLDAVLCSPVDVYPLPADLLARLAGPGPNTLLHQRAVGYWPTHLAPLLDAQLGAGVRSIRAWIEASGAASYDDSALGLRNVNRPSDLAALD